MPSELEQLRATLKAEQEKSELLELRAALKAETAKAQALDAPSEADELRAQLKRERAKAAKLGGDADEASPEPKKKKARRGARKSPGEKKKDEPAPAAAAAPAKNALPAAAASLLASLPVAAVAAPKPAAKAKPTAKAKPAKQAEDAATGPVDAAWAPLVAFTTASDKWRAASARLDELRAAAPGAWAEADAHGAWCEGLPGAYAIDCEMCVCEDPVTGRKTSKELVRVSVVDAQSKAACEANAGGDAHGDVVLDSLVAPSLPVVDAVTRIHGIAADDLKSVTFTRRHAQAALRKLVSSRTVLVGHAIANDLEALQFRHELVADTGILFGLEGAREGASPALRDVAAQLLPAALNDMLEKEHDSRVDARTSALVAHALVGGAELPRLVKRSSPASPSKSAASERCLFAHRIPADVDAAALKARVERATGCAVVGAPDVIRGDGYGKCTLSFKSPDHATLALDTLDGAEDEDKAGRKQKKLFLDDVAAKGVARLYCKIRRP